MGAAPNHGRAAAHDVPLRARPPRRAHLDVLKIVVIAGVIAGHAWAGYTAIGGWSYSDIREVSLAPVSQVIGEAVLGPFGLFAMGLLFLVSGLVSVPSMRRNGAGRFAFDRARRLGLPLIVFTFVLWPPVRAGLDRLAGRAATPWWLPDPVHLWFLEVLLIFSIAVAVWWRWTSAAASTRPLTFGTLVMVGVGVAIGSFIIRLWFPLGSTGPADVHLAQWPQFVALFGLGILAARRGWLDPVPERLRRGCGWAAVVGVAVIGALAVIAAAAGVPAEHFLGGINWASLVTCAAEGLLTVTVPVWLLAMARRHLDRYKNAERGARTAYVAFLLQGHVLVGLAVALRPVDVPAELKATAVAAAGVAVCFAIGRLLVEHTVLGRVL